MKSIDKLKQIQNKNQSILCVGLDPDLNKFPDIYNRNVADVLNFNKMIIDATKDFVCSYKLNFAFFEQYGSEGVDILKETFDYIPKDIFTIADAKRGDIGNTSGAYAESVFNFFGADSVTVNPYMGRDSVQPFLDYNDKMVFILALTSNPGSSDFQRLISGGEPIYKHIIKTSSQWAGQEQTGYVVGATHPSELGEIRQLIPDNVILIPGVGTQGGNPEDVLRANGGATAIINVSRAVIYAGKDKNFAEKAGETAKKYRDEFLEIRKNI